MAAAAHLGGASNHVLSEKAQPERRSAGYMPSLWDDDYIESSTKPTVTENGAGGVPAGGGPPHHELRRRAEALKDRVRVRLADEAAEPDALLELVDALQCLGIDHHFRGEIDGFLGSLWRTGTGRVLGKGSLLSTSRLFRLFRQHHCEISQDVFDAFRNESGSFVSHLERDREALLSLYEASFLAFEGEETLGQAQAFAREKLGRQRRAPVGADSTLEERVARALELPGHRRQPRMQARWFIAVHGETKAAAAVDPALLELAMLDFDMVQAVHRRELMEASKWWKNLGLADKLSFFRDRVVENYFCAVGGRFEPEFWYYRQSMTKIICLIVAMDDLYDIYGTLEELEIFTDAVVRWDVNAIEGLPECLKLCFLALFNTVNEIAYVHLRDKGLDVAPYIRRAWADLCRSWLVEAKWFHKKQTVTFEEYLSNSWVSIGWPVVCIHGFFLLARSATVTEEALQHLQSNPDVIRCSSTLIRLWNDLSTSKAELERGDILKSVQCHMLEKDVSEAAARKHIRELIDEMWKKLNRGWYESTVLGQEFLDLVMDGTRVLHFIYQHGDGYARPDKETKHSILLLLFQPISPKW